MATAYSRNGAVAAAPYNLLGNRPILPLIASVNTGGDPSRKDRLETLLQHLRRVTLAMRGREAARHVSLYIAALNEHKGNLHIAWRLPDAMEALRPAVKFCWGVLDVAAWQTEIEVAHSCGDAWICDRYADAEIAEFVDLVRRCGTQDKALRSGLPEPYQAWLDGEDTRAGLARAMWKA